MRRQWLQRTGRSITSPLPWELSGRVAVDDRAAVERYPALVGEEVRVANFHPLRRLADHQVRTATDTAVTDVSAGRRLASVLDGDRLVAVLPRQVVEQRLFPGLATHRAAPSRTR